MKKTRCKRATINQKNDALTRNNQQKQRVTTQLLMKKRRVTAQPSIKKNDALTRTNQQKTTCNSATINEKNDV